MWTARDNRIFLSLMLALVALAWVSLVIWGHSPYGRYLNHDALAEIELGRDASLLVVFVGGWTLMTVAMMLPTSLPLVVLFRRMTRNRPDNRRLIGLLLAGYLGTWTLFGALAHAADLGLHQVVARAGWLASHAWLIGAGTLLLAGGYQFTKLKYHCLDKCRSPMTFIAGHWTGRTPQRQALRLGVSHGLFCVGCCWSLMLLMFAIGVGNVAWMLALGAIMAIEKNLPWGRQISTPLGITLLGMGALTVAANTL